MATRKDLVVDENGIQETFDDGGISLLVRLLTKPYKKNLEVAPSILGNYCTQKDCCKQAIPNPRIQCRVCCLLGDLARESNEKLCTPVKSIDLTIDLASVLEDSKDIGTLCMAVRAIRLLYSEMPFYEEFVRFDGADKILGILLRSTSIAEKISDATNTTIK